MHYIASSPLRGVSLHSNRSRVRVFGKSTHFDPFIDALLQVENQMRSREIQQHHIFTLSLSPLRTAKTEESRSPPFVVAMIATRSSRVASCWAS